MTVNVANILPCPAVPTRVRDFEDARRLADTVERLRQTINLLLDEVKDHETRIAAVE